VVDSERASGQRVAVATIGVAAAIALLAFLGGRWLRRVPEQAQMATSGAVREQVSPQPVFDDEPPIATSDGGTDGSATSTPGLHVPRYQPRDPEEWQGMLVDLNVSAECELSARCGWALACIGGHCLPCVTDQNCAIGEVCVLDHCLLQRNVTCRRRRDCDGGATCMLTGLSPDPRNNADMRSVCRGGSPYYEQRVAPPRPSVGPQVHPEISSQDLIERLRNQAPGPSQNEPTRR
jgi:hypothetical protein